MGFKRRSKVTPLSPLIGELPGEVQELVTRALAAMSDADGGPSMGIDDYPGLQVVAAPARSSEASKLFRQALLAAGFPEVRTRQGRDWVDIPLLLTAELDRTQRALAEIMARLDGVSIANVAIPGSGWCRRRWLGLAPGGVLEREIEFADGERRVVPLWRALSRLKAEHRTDESRQLVAGLDLSKLERLELFTDVVLGAYGLSAQDCFEWGSKGPEALALSAVDAGCKPWAVATAGRLVRLFASPALHSERHGFNQPPDELCWPLLAALVRSDTPIEPEWEICLRLTYGPPDYVALSRQCLRALPVERRDAAFAAAVERMLPAYGVRTALCLLPDFPSAAVTEYVLAHAASVDYRPKREILAELAELAKQREVMRPALEVYLGEQPPRIELALIRAIEPTDAGELTPMQREQLEHAGKLYDGRALSAAERLSYEGSDQHPGGQDQSFRGFLKIREIADAEGKPAYDAFEYMVDSGAIFRAGTTDVVAEVIQFGLECEDPALKEALQVVLRQG